MVKITGRKIYCTSCKKLVKSNEQKGEAVNSVLCSTCNKTLYEWDGLSWKYVGGNA